MHDSRIIEIVEKAFAQKYTDNAVILELLKHMEALYSKSASSYKVAYEVYRVHPDPAQAYRHRKHITYCWTKDEAHKLIQVHQAHYNPIHVIKLDDKWHRINVQPLDIEGNFEISKSSNLNPIKELT